MRTYSRRLSLIKDPKDGFSDEIPFVFDQMDSSITSIFYTGLASTSTLRLTMRLTMDMMVRPGTIYAPFVRMPPVEDHLAFKMYAEVSRRMADDLSVRYNNLGALIPWGMGSRSPTTIKTFNGGL